MTGQLESGFGSLGRSLAHSDPRRAGDNRYLHQCDQNDGIVIVGGERWVVCHEHFVRWKGDEDFLDYFRDKGFTVVMPSAAGILRYTEIEHHFALSWLSNYLGHARVKVEVMWDLFSYHVLKLPIRLLRRLAWFVYKRTQLRA